MNPALEILIVAIGPYRYGLPVAAVQELTRVVTIVPLPLGPATLEGVVNLRGGVVPVVDVRSRLGLPPKEVELSDHLVILRSGDGAMALRVDQALEIVTGNGRFASLADGALAPILDPASLFVAAVPEPLG